jgi:hypothetical protein
MKEDWKDIPEYVGLYKISNMGEVQTSYEKTNISSSNKILKGGINSHGYRIVTLYKNGIPKSHTVHRLVAEAFLLKDIKRTYVNHKNGIKSDNRSSNLEWCTHSENVSHSYANNLQIPPMKGKKGGDHGAAKRIININTGEIYLSLIEAAIANKINLNTFRCKLSGHRKNNTPFEYV